MLLKIILLPFGVLFGLIMQLRRAMYELGVIRRFTPDIPTVVIGNLNAGGSGKTPHLIYLSGLLKMEGVIVNTLSRGYGRKTKGFLEVDTELSPETCGDEPLLIKQQLPDSRVFVCENRPHGIRQISNFSKSPVLLDDAFQHLPLKAGFYIMLTDYSLPFYLDFPLPAGRLREFRIAAKSADMIIVSKCPETIDEAEKQFICSQIQRYSNAMMVFTSYKQLLPRNPFTKNDLSKNAKAVFVMTGISNPQLLENYILTEFPNSTIRNLRFNDHHTYSEQEITKIQQEAKAESAVIVTTEKDWVKLGRMKIVQENENLWHVAHVAVQSDKHTEDKLLSTIQNFLINFAN